MKNFTSLKVGVEGGPLFGNRSGIGQYTLRLIQAASSLRQSPKFEITKPILFWRRFTAPIKPSPRLSYRVARWLPPILYYQLFKRTGWAPSYELSVLRKYDVLVFFNFVAFPVRKSTPSILFIHDLSHIHYPQFTSPRNLAWLNKFVPRSIKRVDKIVTISESSRNDIAEFYKVPKKNISIVYPAVDHNEYKPRSQKEVAAVKKKFAISKPYILSVCTLEPRKNLIGVLKAFEALPEVTKERYALVLAGGKGWLDGELHAKFEELSKKYTLIKTGYVDDADLPPLYSGADVFVYPAFYEGFGIPPLEAMACGTPVITANNSSLPEVVQEAGIMIKAEDTVALSQQIERVLNDSRLQTKLKNAGLAQAQKFSWQQSAEDFLKIIDSVIKSR